LRCGQSISLSDTDSSGLLVKGNIARTQIDAVQPPGVPGPDGKPIDGRESPTTTPGKPAAPKPSAPKRFHGTVTLDAARVGRDAGRVAEEVIAHLAGLVGASVKVTLEIEAEVPSGAPDNVVRTVTENSRTLKFSSHGFEQE
jgi:hypothetical protein